MAEAQLIEQLKQWIGHRTLVIATHRTAMLQLVDRIIVMDQGRTVMDGAKETILCEQGEPTALAVRVTAVMLLCFLGWTWYFQLDEVTTGSGTVESS